MFHRMVSFLMLTLVVGSAAGATESLSTDGVWWNELSVTQKVDVMFGATSAYSNGYFSGRTKGDSDAELSMFRAMGKLHWSSTQMLHFTKAFQEERERIPNRFDSPDFTGKPMRAYIDGMDYFYSNHPEASKLDFSWVLSCIQNKPTRTCNDVAKLGPR